MTKLKNTHAALHSLQHYLQQPGMEAMKYPSMDEQTKEIMAYIHNIGVSFIHKKKKYLPFVTWMDLQGIMPNEIRQKTILYDLIMCGSKNIDLRYEDHIGDLLGVDKMGEGFKYYKFLVTK